MLARKNLGAGLIAWWDLTTGNVVSTPNPSDERGSCVLSDSQPHMRCSLPSTIPTAEFDESFCLPMLAREGVATSLGQTGLPHRLTPLKFFPLSLTIYCTDLHRCVGRLRRRMWGLGWFLIRLSSNWCDGASPFGAFGLSTELRFWLVLVWSRSTLVLASPSVQLCLPPKSAAADSFRLELALWALCYSFGSCGVGVPRSCALWSVGWACFVGVSKWKLLPTTALPFVRLVWLCCERAESTDSESSQRWSCLFRWSSTVCLEAVPFGVLVGPASSAFRSGSGCRQLLFPSFVSVACLRLIFDQAHRLRVQSAMILSDPSGFALFDWGALLV